jgi:predicted RNA-binding Zn-ribbon protein involved in translation (DUF1610 family)
MQQRLFICPSCGRDVIVQPHRPNCPELREQTNLKCREFGMEPYYQEARDFPRPFPRTPP